MVLKDLKGCLVLRQALRLWRSHTRHPPGSLLLCFKACCAESPRANSRMAKGAELRHMQTSARELPKKTTKAAEGKRSQPRSPMP